MYLRLSFVLVVCWMTADREAFGQTEPSRTVMLVVSSDPEGAQVYVGQSLLGTTPFAARTTISERTKIVFIHPDRARHEEMVPLPTSDSMMVHAILPVRSGILTVFSQPLRSHIVIDEKMTFRGSSERLVLPLGPHHIRVTDSTTGRSHEMSIDLHDMGPVVTSIRLNVKDPIRLGWAAITPGLPQFLDGSYLKGSLITGVVVASWVNLLSSIDEFRETEQTYNWALFSYETASTSEVAVLARKAVLDAHAQHARAVRGRNLAYGLLAGAYVLSMIDTYFNHMTVIVSEVRIQGSTSISGSRIRLTMEVLL